MCKVRVGHSRRVSVCITQSSSQLALIKSIQFVHIAEGILKMHAFLGAFVDWMYSLNFLYCMFFIAFVHCISFLAFSSVHFLHCISLSHDPNTQGCCITCNRCRTWHLPFHSSRCGVRLCCAVLCCVVLCWTVSYWNTLHWLVNADVMDGWMDGWMDWEVIWCTDR